LAANYGQNAHAAGNFAAVGDAQTSQYVLRTTTSDATADVELFLDGSSSRIIIPPTSARTFTVQIVAYNNYSTPTAAGYIVQGCIRRDASNNTVLASAVTATLLWEEGVMSGCSVLVDADDTNEALRIRVTGLANRIIRWVASVRTTEVAHPGGG
jgi:hypothetical protein